MPTLDSDAVAEALLGTMQARTENRSHRYFYIYDDEGTRISQTHISHGRKHPIGSSLLTQMARQLRLDTARDLVDLVRCPLSREDALTEMQRNSMGPSERG
jgi:hypothetical protein